MSHAEFYCGNVTIVFLKVAPGNIEQRDICIVHNDIPSYWTKRWDSSKITPKNINLQASR